MTMDRHDTIGAMLDEYALGQLSQDERRDVETHVRECDVCAADLRELTIVMEGLAHSPDPVTPPPALKQRVLASLATQPQESPRTTCRRQRCRDASEADCDSTRSALRMACRRGTRHPRIRSSALFLQRDSSSAR